MGVRNMYDSNIHLKSMRALDLTPASDGETYATRPHKSLPRKYLDVISRARILRLGRNGIHPLDNLPALAVRRIKGSTIAPYNSDNMEPWGAWQPDGTPSLLPDSTEK